MDHNILDEFIETDVLVIGGGLAGCMAAIEASKHGVRTIIALEGRIGKSGCTPLAGGPGGADFMVDSSSISTILELDELGPERPNMNDSPDIFKEDIIADGNELNNRKMVDVYTSDAPHTMKKLMEMDLKIKEINYAHGSRYPRGVIVLHEDISSMMIRNVRRSIIEILEDTKITELLLEDRKIGGAVGIKIPYGELIGIETKAAIIATGGWQMAYHTGGSDELTGDGQAMALKVGAEVVDMEFGTFHDRYLNWPPFASRDNFAWQWGVERKLVNIFNEEFLKKDPADMDFYYSTLKISKEISNGHGSPHGGVYLLNPKEAIGEGYLNMASKLMDWDIDDISFEVCVGFHYCNGGVRVNEKTETAIPGLFAAGEAAGGLFGARRIASALTEAAVQGFLSGKNASIYSKSVHQIKLNSKQIESTRKKLLSPLEKPGEISPSKLRRELRQITSLHLSPYRTEEKLSTALNAIRKIRRDEIPKIGVTGTDSRRFNREWIDCLSLDNLLICLEASAMSALARKESRGFHRRDDFPARDDKHWMVNNVVRKGTRDMKIYQVPVVSASNFTEA
jgi:succinate dehydrogenase/fumarate reductase flavoprotein subunit